MSRKKTLRFEVPADIFADFIEHWFGSDEADKVTSFLDDHGTSYAKDELHKPAVVYSTDDLTDWREVQVKMPAPFIDALAQAAEKRDDIDAETVCTHLIIAWVLKLPWMFYEAGKEFPGKTRWLPKRPRKHWYLSAFAREGKYLPFIPYGLFWKEWYEFHVGDVTRESQIRKARRWLRAYPDRYDAIYLNYGFERRPVEPGDPIEVLYRWDSTDTMSTQAPPEPVDAHAEPVQPVPALPTPITPTELPEAPVAFPAALGVGMAAEDFKAAREALGVDRKQLAVLLDSNERLLRRWENGEIPVPHVVAVLVRLLLDDRVSLDEIVPV